jgi:hypothetical protein
VLRTVRAATVADENPMTLVSFKKADFENCGACGVDSHVSIPMCRGCGVRKSTVANKQATKGSQTVTKQVQMTPEEWAFAQAAPARIAELEKRLAEEKATTKALAASIAKHNPSAFDEPVDKTVAMEALEKGLTSFCKSKGITKNLWTDGLAAFRETDEGRALSDDVNNAE